MTELTECAIIRIMGNRELAARSSEEPILKKQKKQGLEINRTYVLYRNKFWSPEELGKVPYKELEIYAGTKYLLGEKFGGSPPLSMHLFRVENCPLTK